MARILGNLLEIYKYWLWLDFNSIFQYSFTVCWLNNSNNNNNNNNNNNIIIIIIITTTTAVIVVVGNTGLMSKRGHSLALVGNPSIDGV